MEDQKNKLKPDERAIGVHSTFKRDGDGNITNYETYTINPKNKNRKNPKGFEKRKQYDANGRLMREFLLLISNIQIREEMQN